MFSDISRHVDFDDAILKLDAGHDGEPYIALGIGSGVAYPHRGAPLITSDLFNLDGDGLDGRRIQRDRLHLGAEPERSNHKLRSRNEQI